MKYGKITICLFILSFGFIACLPQKAMAEPNDANIVDADYIGEENKLKIGFKDGGKYYWATQFNAIVYIEAGNSTFVAAHASNGSGDKIRHRHARYDYGSGPTGDPNWGGPPDPNWPDTTKGKAFWDWAYTGYCDGSGTDPSTQTNCVQYAFDNYGGASASQWVDSGWGDCNDLWTDLTRVCPTTGDADATSTSCNTVAVNDGDIAGDDSHVWVLKDPSGAATKIEWKNNCSGKYTWTHTKISANCGVSLGLKDGDGGTPPAYGDHTNSYMKDMRIYRN